MNVDKMKELLEMLGAKQYQEGGDIQSSPSQEVIDAINQMQDPFAGMQRPEETIGPIPQGGISELLEWDDEKMGMSQQDLLDMIMPFGGIGKITKTAKNVIPYITGRNVKAVQNIKAHQNIDKLISNKKAKEHLERWVNKPKYESGDLYKRGLHKEKLIQKELIKDSKLSELAELLKLNPGSKITGQLKPGKWGIKLPDAPVAATRTPQSGGGIMGALKKMLPWGLLGTTSDTPE